MLNRRRPRGCTRASRSWGSYSHPGVEMRAKRQSIFHRCHLFEVAFVWELTEETIHLPRCCFHVKRTHRQKLKSRRPRGCTRASRSSATRPRCRPPLTANCLPDQPSIRQIRLIFDKSAFYSINQPLFDESAFYSTNQHYFRRISLLFDESAIYWKRTQGVFFFRTRSRSAVEVPSSNC